MWKCSKCGAMSDGDICSACGEVRSEEIEEVKTSEAVFEETEATEETVEETETEVLTPPETEEAEMLEEVPEEIAEEIEEIGAPAEWICPVCGEKCDDEECPKCGEMRPEGYNIVDFAPPKKNKKIIALIAIVAVVVLVTAGIFGYYFLNRNVDRTGENAKVTYEDLMSASDSIFGDEVILKVNGIEVPKTIFESYLTNAGLYYQQDYCYTDNGQFDVTRLEKFKWTDIADKKTGKTHRETVIETTVNNCIEIYSIIAMGEKYNLKPSEDDLDAIENQIESYEEQYGDEFGKILKLNGYSSVEQFRELLNLDAQVSAVVADLQEHPDRYINEDRSVYAMDDLEAISAKHILIMVDEENGVDKKTAKEKAEKVLKKVKAGEDFDDLIEEYNQDSGQPEEGYTFGKGQMVEEFEKAAFALKPDETSGLVETTYGFHIIKRIVTYTDVITYEKREAKVFVNKSEIKDMEVTSDLLEIQKESTN